jgi:hypothetical protein
MAKIYIVAPDAPPEATEQLRAERTLGSGIRLGVLDNSKGNADYLLQFIVDELKSSVPIDSVVSLRKPSVSLPAPSDMLDKLADEADVVVSAMAD